MTTYQDVDARVFLNDGRIVKINRITNDYNQLSVRTTLGEIIPAAKVVQILNEGEGN